MGYIKQGLLGALTITIVLRVALAALGGGETPRSGASLRDDDYRQALSAFEQRDWKRLVEAAERVIERRPWHDDAHNLLGYAYRQLGDYEQALQHYYRALELNPHHRGALEYLGDAYLELGQLDNAKALLLRLATECQRVAEPNSDWRKHCEEWRDLQEAIEAFEAQPTGCAVDPSASLQLGQRGFYRSCVHCHGLRPSHWPIHDAQNFAQIVTNGTARKPPMGFKLSLAEVETIRLYVEHCLSTEQMC